MAQAQAVAAAMAETWALLASTLAQGWARPEPTVMALVTGMPIPTLNGAWAYSDAVAAGDLERALLAVREDGFPFCAQLRPSASAEAHAVPSRLGMAPGPDVPLMAIDGPARASSIELSYRVLEPEEAGLHCAIAGPAFGAPPELFAQIMTPEVLALEQVRVLVAEDGGRPVATAVSVRLGDHVGVFNVATPPEHRRRGIGGAISARILQDGLDAGARTGWLQSSEDGFGVYEALGFRTLETWKLWLSV